MVRSLNSAVAGLKAHQNKLDVIGNNIANVNTVGYKSSRVVFRDMMYQTTSGSSAAGNGQGGTNATQIGYGSSIASISTVFTPGAFYSTGSGIDAMISGNGYFLVGDANATTIDEMYLTRNGEFTLDAEGYLVDSMGNYVYGYNSPATADKSDPSLINTTTLTRIRIPVDQANAPDLYELREIKMTSNGQVYGLDDDNKAIYLGQVAVATVTNDNGLESQGNSLFLAGPNSGAAEHNVPGTGSAGSLMVGGLEMSTVDLSQEMTDMITTQRGFQANSRIITVTDEMLQELVNLKR